MTYLLYHKKSAPTGAAIARALGVDHGYGYQEDEFQPLKISYPLIRWGARGSVKDYLVLGDLNFNRLHPELNPINAISNTSHKLESLCLMKEAGLSIPAFSTNPEDLLARYGWPLLGRRINHARGNDIILCLQNRDLMVERDFYTQYIPTKREYRIHVAFGEVIRTQGKFIVSRDKLNSHVRNHEHGYVFRAPRKRLNSDRYALAIAAVAAHGLDFGAVDLVVGDDKKAYVLEVNTAPSCSPLTATAYVQAFQNHLGIPESQIDLSQLRFLSATEENETDDLEVEDDS